MLTAVKFKAKKGIIGPFGGKKKYWRIVVNAIDTSGELVTKEFASPVGNEKAI